jgi:hypothetical protein
VYVIQRNVRYVENVIAGRMFPRGMFLRRMFLRINFVRRMFLGRAMQLTAETAQQ